MACLAAVAPAQGPLDPLGGKIPPLPPPALQGTAPLLHLRFLGPPGMHVTFYKGLLQEMQKVNFHTTIAFIPWNFDRSRPEPCE